MREIFKVFIANLIFLIIFACIYIKIKDQFSHNSEKIVSNMDCLLFSSALQSGSGFIYIRPTTDLCKFISLIQIIILISIHIIPAIIYFA
jgi:hypothetical protein